MPCFEFHIMWNQLASTDREGSTTLPIDHSYRIYKLDEPGGEYDSTD
uniref:Uncharacterized protein n=1 Tax=Arundo donax TaxID=35708 RepID=A0A0A9BPH1_ARUDO